MAKEAKQGLWVQAETVRKQASREDMGNKPEGLAHTPGPLERSWWMMMMYQTENKQGVGGREGWGLCSQYPQRATVSAQYPAERDCTHGTLREGLRSQ